ncbi:MobF family relaxase [Angustibacter peucedani]
MTVHKLSAGDGYTYLTRQVASADQARDGQALADYYAESGTPPGRWMGAGARQAEICGAVSVEQMRALFGRGEHPTTEVPLGASFPTATAARKPVAGYDLVFSPVKSVSLLWALGEDDVRRAVEQAHHAAVADVLSWLEQHAAFTRVGRGGRFQVDTYGLVAAAFDHFESRAGDPDLHTHVAVANKVRARLDRPDGTPRWLSLDGKALYAVGVAASERYNTRLEDEMRSRLPVRFEPRLDGRHDRPVREVAGIPLELVDQFSTRRRNITAALGELEQRYRRSHGREPSRAVRLRLAQEATLSTRDAKSTGAPLHDLRRRWWREARLAIGEEGVTEAMLAAVASRPRQDVSPPVDVALYVEAVLATLRESRSSWTRWNLLAEVERQVRPAAVSGSDERQRLVDTVVDRCRTHTDTISVDAPAGAAEDLYRLCGVETAADLPDTARRADGTPVSTAHGTERYTSRTLLNAELDLLDAATASHGAPIDQRTFDAAVATAQNHERSSSAEQVRAAQHLCLSPHVLTCLVGPAGAGKTTTLKLATAAWQRAGRRVIALAPSSAAAQVLADELAVPADNIHKWLHDIAVGRADPLRRGDVVLIDEAGMAGTMRLATITDAARSAGATVRLIGDPHQLAAVEAGGAFRLLTTSSPTAELRALHRFTTTEEANATTAVRDGDARAAKFYADAGRLDAGSSDAMTEAAFSAWRTDVAKGLHSLLLTTDREQARSLNERAQLARRLHSTTAGALTVGLHDGTQASAGDWIVTRANARMLQTDCGRDFVKNGDGWLVRHVATDGSLMVQRRSSQSVVRLPSHYVAKRVELGYAVTVHRAQGLTCETAHASITTGTGREALYVAVSRARQRSHLYLVRDVDSDTPHASVTRTPTPSPAESLAACITRSDAEPSALETVRRPTTGDSYGPTGVAAAPHTQPARQRQPALRW